MVSSTTVIGDFINIYKSQADDQEECRVIQHHKPTRPNQQ